MASILKVDELQGIVSAGDITVTSEGGAATQSLQQGLAKSWLNFNGTGTIATRDSLNVSGLVDNGTGDYSITYSSAPANANYCVTSSSGQAERPLRTGSDKSASNITTSLVRLQQHYGTSGVALGEDVGFVAASINGDLA